MQEFHDKIRSYEVVANPFNNTYSDHVPIKFYGFNEQIQKVESKFERLKILSNNNEALEVFKLGI